MLECGSNVVPMVTVALAGSDGPVAMEVPEPSGKTILDVFLNQLAGKPDMLNNEIILRSARDALTIQAVATGSR